MAPQPRIQPPENRYSRFYRGDRELIDHILVTRHVADGDVTAGPPDGAPPASTWPSTGHFPTVFSMSPRRQPPATTSNTGV